MCQNKKCVEMRKKKAELRDKYSFEWQEKLELFKENLEKKQARLAYHSHFEKRSFERVINNKHVLEVLKEGEVIDRQVHFGEERFIIMSYVKTAPKVYRPIHLVVCALDEQHWVALTAYCPESQPHKWNEFLDERICFC